MKSPPADAPFLLHKTETQCSSGTEKPKLHVEVRPILHKAESQCSSDTKKPKLREEVHEVQLKGARIAKWGVGRQTPLLMIGSYILAFLIATAHLCLFLYLDGKPIDGSDRSVPAQSYVSATSTILANLFGLTMTTSVGIVFTQYLWYLLRQSAWKVSTIESMFSMQTNPLMLRHPDVLKGAPLLGLLASIMWSIQAAANFAPGALIIGPVIRYSNQTSDVPTFDSTFVGNGSAVDANFYSLDPFQVWEGLFYPDSQLGTYSATLSRLTSQTMITGAPSRMSSPCGTNCSYTLTFEAPYLQCPPLDISYTVFGANDSRLEDGDLGGGFPVFQGLAFDPYLSSPYYANSTTGNSTTGIEPSQFTFTSYQVIGWGNGWGNASEREIDSPVVARIYSLNCTPASIIYTVLYSFTNNVLSTSISNSSVKGITDLAAPVQSDSGVIFPGFITNGSLTTGGQSETGLGLLGYEPLNWNSSWRSWYSNLQMMAVINSMARSLNGTYYGTASVYGNTTNTFPSAWGLGDDVWYTDVVWVDDTGGFPTNFINEQYLRSTIALYTKLNENFGQFNISQVTEEIGSGYQNYPLNFTVRQEIFNEFLLNITLSMISDIGWWKTPTTVTTWASINSFLFSQPLHLLLPYSISLVLSLPILVLGAWTLRRNGISAMNGSFIQIATSTTGSKALERALAGSCLGGDGNVTEELGELRVRFGQLKNASDGDRKKMSEVRRAGFGIDGEVEPLVRKGSYGME